MAHLLFLLSVPGMSGGSIQFIQRKIKNCKDIKLLQSLTLGLHILSLLIVVGLGYYGFTTFF
ncbi:hypothetical protein ACI1UF_05715 [Lactococcus garvieae]